VIYGAQCCNLGTVKTETKNPSRLPLRLGFTKEARRAARPKPSDTIEQAIDVPIDIRKKKKAPAVSCV
jgi:hypothetical protein